jgi:hypothetical protein
MIFLSGPSAFQWSIDEQVYPLEKDSSGNTLYCKEITFAMPQNGASYTAMNITNFDPTKVFRMICHLTWPDGSGTGNVPVPYVSSANPAFDISYQTIDAGVYTGYLYFETHYNYGAPTPTVIFKIIYSK